MPYHEYAPDPALRRHVACYWTLTVGDWTEARLSEFRLQHTEELDTTRLARFAAAFQSPRLDRAVAAWARMGHDEGAGTVLL